MNKKTILLLILIALGIGAYYTLGTLLGAATKTAVNAIAPDITGTTVNLGGAYISPFTGTGTLTNLVVGNPEGFKSEKAFSIGKVHVDIDVLSIFSDTIVINEVIIQKAEFIYETKILRSNIGTILDNVEKSSEPKTPAEKPAETASTKPAKKIAIKRFVLEDATVGLSIVGATMPVPVPRLELRDIGTKENGVTPAQAASVALKRILASVGEAAANGVKLGEKVGKAAKEAGEQISEGVKSLFKKD